MPPAWMTTIPAIAVQQVLTARAAWTVDGARFEVGPGAIVVAKAGEVHSFQNVGEGLLVQLDLHLAPRFTQEDL